MSDEKEPEELAPSEPAGAPYSPAGAGDETDLSQDGGPPRPLPLMARLFLIPFLIVAACALVILIYRLLSTGEQTASDYVAEIRSGSGHRRWQAAYELSLVLGRDDVPRDPRLAGEMTRLFLDYAGRDPLARRYLALSLGRIRAREAGPALIAALDDPDPETRVYAAWALGALTDSSAVRPLAARSTDADPGMRKVVAYSLGAIGDPSARPVLRTLLEDDVPDVRWNAAVALARLGDDAGRSVLAQMIDRNYLMNFTEMTPEQRDEAVLGGVRGIGLLGGQGFEEALDRLAERDPSPRVRAAADEARRRSGSEEPASKPAGDVG